MEWGKRFSRTARGKLAFRMRPFGIEDAFELYKSLEEYTLEGIAERIDCPILITDPEGEQFWPGDSRKLYDAVATPADRKALVGFSAAEGGDSHCEPKGNAIRAQRILDWLDEILA